MRADKSVDDILPGPPEAGLDDDAQLDPDGKARRRSWVTAPGAAR
jgi:hypothetical protein